MNYNVNVVKEFVNQRPLKCDGNYFTKKGLLGEIAKNKKIVFNKQGRGSQSIHFWGKRNNDY